MTQPWTHTAGAVAYPRVDEWYVEPEWVSARLFQEETFSGNIYDPCCGMGRIVVSALKSGYSAYGSDIVNRGWDAVPRDFLQQSAQHDNIVTNPPFDKIRAVTEHALRLARRKVAVIMPTARLNAARWLIGSNLETVWLLTPRPSMPPGHHIQAGGKVGGGKSDYCWLVFSKGYDDLPALCWLGRDDLKGTGETA